MKYVTTLNGKTFEIEINKDGTLLVNGHPRTVDFLALGPELYSIIRENESYEVVIEEDADGVQVQLRGQLFSGTVLDERAQLMASLRGGPASETGEVSIKAPMPGLIVVLPVSEGQEVVQGQTVVILESMKMQNELKAPRAGTVQRISVNEGQSVEQGKLLVTIV
ncbi:MAG: biotin/lipoyl-binding protein [Pleurocapsa minor GSE-CHR-MK-17-07R]|jgi:biotin carboxyl carrier protein|nr:biotin/lipoyl-binding protein [Pleurocapsa minor GSE-CHR-MK 17-07R]